ncbi:MAG: A/G-specific adenine glycosylase [Planctomycetota bacterium]
MGRRTGARAGGDGLEARAIAAVRRVLLRWYARTARDLPWRRAPDPYRVWISETMLQQTQVERVCDAFGRFLDSFPTVAALAAADESAVLRAWEGLGYYRRARQLHAAARVVVAEHGGRLPEDDGALRRLPGIGRYTAGAIRSIALGQPAPIVEANSRRVLARLVGHRAEVGGAADEPLWQVAARLVPPQGAGAFNQALMDLGATVCTPRAPRCTRCPLLGHCRAHAGGLTGSIPRLPRPRAAEVREETALVIRHAEHVLVEQRRPGEWWEGLWDFPRLPASGLAGLRPGPPHEIGRIVYTVTHHRITLRVVVRRAARRTRLAPPRAWVSVADLAGLALSSPGRRIARMLADDGTEPPPRRRSRYVPAPGTTSSSAREKKRA